jgi:hypothetical protein
MIYIALSLMIGCLIFFLLNYTSINNGSSKCEIEGYEETVERRITTIVFNKNIYKVSLAKRNMYPDFVKYINNGLHTIIGIEYLASDNPGIDSGIYSYYDAIRNKSILSINKDDELIGFMKRETIYEDGLKELRIEYAVFDNMADEADEIIDSIIEHYRIDNGYIKVINI